MSYTQLGRTGLKVSVVGLGSGGYSRLGLKKGKSIWQAVDLIHQALSCGVNLIDTAEAYYTEALVGEAIRGMRRDRLVLSSKTEINRNGHRITPKELAASVERSLTRLKTDYIDIYHCHGVAASDYDYVVETLLPSLIRLKAAGKIRAIGLTEAFSDDTAHAMLSRAVQDDYWDVVMVGFNLLNQSARERVLPLARQHNMGVLNMFAVRRAMTHPDSLLEAMALLEDDASSNVSPLTEDIRRYISDTLYRSGQVTSLPDAAYRFCRHEPGVDVVLFGTSNPQHLHANIQSLLAPPLPDADAERFRTIFAGVTQLSGR